MELNVKKDGVELDDEMKLVVDDCRTGFNRRETGVYVRAQHNGVWGSYDVASLDGTSLLKWLRSRGGNNPWAENFIGILLGYPDPLTAYEKK